MPNFFKKIDYLGQQIGFENDDSTNYKTNQGAFFTLIVIISCSVIGFIFGQEIYLRENPIVRYSKTLESISKVDVNKFPFLIGVSFTNGSIVKNIDEYMNPFFFYSVTTPDLVTTSTFRSIGRCTSANLTSYRSDFNNLSCDNGGCYCVNRLKMLLFRINLDRITLLLFMLGLDHVILLRENVIQE